MFSRSPASATTITSNPAFSTASARRRRNHPRADKICDRKRELSSDYEWYPIDCDSRRACGTRVGCAVGGVAFHGRAVVPAGRSGLHRARARHPIYPLRLERHLSSIRGCHTRPRWTDRFQSWRASPARICWDSPDLVPSTGKSPPSRSTLTASWSFSLAAGVSSSVRVPARYRVTMDRFRRSRPSPATRPRSSSKTVCSVGRHHSP